MDIPDLKNAIPEIRNFLERFKNWLYTTEASIGELQFREAKNRLK